MVTLLIGIILLSSLISIVFWSVWNGISPMPSTPRAKKAILTSLRETIHKNGIVYELGAGWGTLAFSIAKNFPNQTIIAIENSPLPFLVCKLISLLISVPNLTFYRKDFYTIPLHDAQVVICYLYPEAMLKLKDKFEKDFFKPTWVISNTFAIPGKDPVKVVALNDLYQTKIYLYSYPT